MILELISWRMKPLREPAPEACRPSPPILLEGTPAEPGSIRSSGAPKREARAEYLRRAGSPGDRVFFLCPQRPRQNRPDHTLRVYKSRAFRRFHRQEVHSQI